MQTVIQPVQLPFLKHNVDIETQRMTRSVGLLVFLEDNSIPLVWHWTQSTKLEFNLTDRGGWELAARAMVPFLECLQKPEFDRSVIRCWLPKQECCERMAHVQTGLSWYCKMLDAKSRIVLKRCWPPNENFKTARFRRGSVLVTAVRKR